MPHVLIIGGGIGGLTAAVALGRRGWQTSVFEAADELRPVGKGISVQINAMQVLERLGLATAVAAAGWPLERGELRTSANVLLTAAEFGPVQARYPHGTVAIRRSDLVRVLADAIPADALHLGKRLTHLEPSPAGVTARFEDGSEVAGDLLVGADGIHSAVREATLPGVTLRYSGQTCCRGICDFALPADLAHTSVEVWGGQNRFGFLNVGSGQVYWFAPFTHPAGGTDNKDLAERYAGFPDPIPAILACTPAAEIIRTDLFDFAPIRRWRAGRVVLLGDAAHAMTPNLGQGGCQAIEDAYILAEQLAGSDALASALARYEKIRMPRVRWIVNTSWQFGQVAHWENRAARWIRDRALQRTPGWVSQRSLARMYTLNY